MKRAVFFSVGVLLLFCVALSVLAFTVKTRVKDPEEEIHKDLSEMIPEFGERVTRKIAELEGVSFKIDATGFRDWHSDYYFVPYTYWPRLLSKEGEVTSEQREASFRVFQGDTQLDCGPAFYWTDMHKEGEEQNCDLGNGESIDGIVKYRIYGIKGPDYTLTKKGKWYFFQLYDIYNMKEGEDPGVEIEFSVAFRENKEGEKDFTEWISTEEELKEKLGLEGSEAGQEEEVPGVEETEENCKPVISKIIYKGVEHSEPDSFNYTHYGDSFSVVILVNESCPVRDALLGFWDSSGLSGEPEAWMDLLPDETEQLDLQGIAAKSILISKAPYPEKLFLGARLVTSSGKQFHSKPVEFFFPSAGQPPENGEQPPREELTGCAPCKSIVGCLACLDHALVTDSFD